MSKPKTLETLIRERVFKAAGIVDLDPFDSQNYTYHMRPAAIHTLVKELLELYEDITRPRPELQRPAIDVEIIKEENEDSSSNTTK